MLILSQQFHGHLLSTNDVRIRFYLLELLGCSIEYNENTDISQDKSYKMLNCNIISIIQFKIHQ